MKCETTKDKMFESIYRSYEEDVYRACLHITKDEELACEVTQQTFVNFYERFDTLKIECMKAYLISSARNTLYNYYRKSNKERSLEDEEAELQETELVSESVEKQYFEDIRNEMIKELTNEILMELKERHEKWYEIVYRIFCMGMSPEEIAEELGITRDVVYSRLRWARRWIRKNYQQDFKNATERF